MNDSHVMCVHDGAEGDKTAADKLGGKVANDGEAVVVNGSDVGLVVVGKGIGRGYIQHFNLPA